MSEIVMKAEQSGYSEVTIPVLKYEDYLHYATLNGAWEERYKMFYGISPDIKINYQ